MIIDRFRGEYAFLSNFDVCFSNGKSVEHYYQAAKCKTSVDYLKILQADTPRDAKLLSKSIEIRTDWFAVRLIIMEELLKQKFTIPKYSNLLLQTNDSLLIEGNFHRDTFWGVYEGVGENQLGKLLMKIRDNFLTTESLIEY